MLQLWETAAGAAGQAVRAAPATCTKMSFLLLLLFPDFIFRAPIKLSKPGELREEYESQLRKVRCSHCGFSSRVPSRNAIPPVRTTKGFQFPLWNSDHLSPSAAQTVQGDALERAESSFWCRGLPSRAGRWARTVRGGPRTALSCVGFIGASVFADKIP